MFLEAPEREEVTQSLQNGLQLFWTLLLDVRLEPPYHRQLKQEAQITVGSTSFMTSQESPGTPTPSSPMEIVQHKPAGQCNAANA